MEMKNQKTAVSLEKKREATCSFVAGRGHDSGWFNMFDFAEFYT